MGARERTWRHEGKGKVITSRERRRGRAWRHEGESMGRGRGHGGEGMGRGRFNTHVLTQGKDGEDPVSTHSHIDHVHTHPHIGHSHTKRREEKSQCVRT